ncbi:antibiotic biosynthesis monooxygenase [Rubripirellula sp.]|jgi:quinol monooxygenase YgiN|nr:putative quinol monooxygenase [Rubripirellula sp.]MDB4749883.1 antibiotic biosynthesis monooxygenase [Rubripirellula sp.]
MIHVVAQIALTPNSRKDFLVEFNQVVPPVRAEAGCIEYAAAVDASTDLERQHRDPDCVTIIEKWETLEHLQDHLNSSHMLLYRERVGGMISHVQLNILDPA